MSDDTSSSWTDSSETDPICWLSVFADALGIRCEESAGIELYNALVEFCDDKDLQRRWMPGADSVDSSFFIAADESDVVFFYRDFGAALVVQYDAETERTTVSVVHPNFSDGWHTSEAAYLVPEPTKFSTNHLLCGVVEDCNVETFKETLDKVIAAAQRDHKYTPSWIAAKATATCNMIRLNTIDERLGVLREDDRTSRLNCAAAASSAGGTMNVNQHTGAATPNMDWPLVQALFMHAAGIDHAAEAEALLCAFEANGLSQLLLGNSNRPFSATELLRIGMWVAHRCQSFALSTNGQRLGQPVFNLTALNALTGPLQPVVAPSPTTAPVDPTPATANGFVRPSPQLPLPEALFKACPTAHVSGAASDAITLARQLPLRVEATANILGSNLKTLLDNHSTATEVQKRFVLCNFEQLMWTLMSYIHDSQLSKVLPDNEAARETLLTELTSMLKPMITEVETHDYGINVLKSQVSSHVLLLKYVSCCLAYEIALTLSKWRDIIGTFRPPLDSAHLTTLSSIDHTARVAAAQCQAYLDRVQGDPLFPLDNKPGLARLASAVFARDTPLQLKCRQYEDKLEKEKVRWKEEIEAYRRAVEEAKQAVAAAQLAQKQQAGTSSGWGDRRWDVDSAERNLKFIQGQKICSIISDLPAEKDGKEFHTFLRHMPAVFGALADVMMWVQGGKHELPQTHHISSKYGFRQCVSVYCQKPQSAVFFKEGCQPTCPKVVFPDAYKAVLLYNNRRGVVVPDTYVDILCHHMGTQDGSLQWIIDHPNIEESSRENLGLQLLTQTKQCPVHAGSNDLIQRIAAIRSAPSTQLSRALEFLTCSDADIVTTGTDSTCTESQKQKRLHTVVPLQTVAYIKSLTDSFEAHAVIKEFLARAVEKIAKPEDVASLGILAPICNMLAAVVSHSSEFSPNEKTEFHKANTQRHLAFLNVAKEAVVALQKETGNDKVILLNHAMISLKCIAALCVFHDVPHVEYCPELVELYCFFRINASVSTAMCAAVATTANGLARLFAHRKNMQQIADASVFRALPCIADMLMSSPSAMVGALRAVSSVDETQRNASLEQTSSRCQQLKSGRTPEYILVLHTLPHGDVFQVDLSTGDLLKNGEQLCGLPSKHRQSETFVKFFGTDCNFDVFPIAGRPTWFETRRCFRESLFPSWAADTQVVFEFGEHSVFVTVKSPAKVDRWRVLTNAETRQLELETVLPRFLLEGTCQLQCGDCIQFREFPCEKLRSCTALYNRRAQRLVLVPNDNAQQLFGADFDVTTSHYTQLVPHSEMIARLPATHLKALAKLEDNQHTHCLLRHNGDVVLWLRRFQLKFHVGPNLELVAENARGYEVLISGFHSDHPFAHVRSLVLHKSKPGTTSNNNNNSNPATLMNHTIRLLLPIKKIDAGGTSTLTTNFRSIYRVVSLDQHEHFGDYRGATRTSLLQLVRVCSSIHTAVLLPAIDMTCQEYALHLLRRCYSTVPLQKEELSMLLNIFSHGCPSVKLACNIVLRQSEVAESFFSPGGCNDTLQIQMKQYYAQSDLMAERVLQMALASYESDVRRGLMPQRLMLHPRERELFAMTFSMPMQARIMKPTTPYANDDTCDVVESVLRPCQELWSLISQFCLFMLGEDDNNNNNKNDAGDDDFPLTNCPSDADCAALHNHFIEDLRQSWTFLSAEVTVTEGMQKKVQKLARTAMTTIEDGLATLGSTLQNFRGHYVSGETDSWLSVFMKLRYCCLPVEREFSLLVSDPSGYLSQHYPWIHASDATLLTALATAWLGLCVMHDTCLRLVGMPTNALTAEVLRLEATSPRDDITRRPFWLAFEVEQRAQIRLAQYDTFVQLTETSRGPIAQLNMGEGKTHMIIPMMVLHYVFSEP
eukprot:PhM_4_TR14664/c0_g1_i7/m.35523